MKKDINRSRVMVLAMLIAMFVLPGCLAVLFYMHPQWLSGGTTNNGELVMPVFKLDNFSTDNKWQLVMLGDRQCDATCVQALDKLARVRLALGRQSRAVSVSLRVTDEHLLPQGKAQHDMEKVAIDSHVLSLKNQDLLTQKHYRKGFLIVDPKGIVVLYYPPQTEQKSIYKDIKHLITLAKQ